MKKPFIVTFPFYFIETWEKSICSFALRRRYIERSRDARAHREKAHEKSLWLLVGMTAVALAQAAGQGLRPAAFAGQFYPAEPAPGGRYRRLSAAAAPAAPLRQILASSFRTPGTCIRRTAAAAYALVRGRAIDTVVIIGPSHRVAFEGCSIWPDGGFETPLGVARVDAALAKEITKASGFRFRPEAFAKNIRSKSKSPSSRKPCPGRPSSPSSWAARPARPSAPWPRHWRKPAVQKTSRRGLDGPVPFPAEGRGAGDRRSDGRPHPGYEHRNSHPQNRSGREHHVAAVPVAAVLLTPRRRANPGSRSCPDRFVRLRRPDRRLSRRSRPLRRRSRSFWERSWEAGRSFKTGTGKPGPEERVFAHAGRKPNSSSWPGRP